MKQQTHSFFHFRYCWEFESKLPDKPEAEEIKMSSDSNKMRFPKFKFEFVSDCPVYVNAHCVCFYSAI